MSKSDKNENFEKFLNSRFDENLRKSGKRKWKSFFWVLFMFLTSILIFGIGIFRYKYENESLGDLWSVFLLGTLVGIPGFFYGFILLMIFLGVPGFHFNMIPESR